MSLIYYKTVKQEIAIASVLFFVLASALVFAQLPSGYNNAQMNGLQDQQGNDFGTGGFDMGMPSGSFADPEYVAQQRMIENMTTAYNWIALNTTRFADGCRKDKAALTTEITNVVQQAQETSLVCQRFSQEAADCSPEIFCSRFTSGQMPIPPEAKSALKRLGYDPASLKMEDMTPELTIKICMAMTQPEIEQRKQMIERAKAKILEQLPAFRQKCEEFKKNREFEIRLPDFGGFPGPTMPQQPQDQGPQQPRQEPWQQGPGGCSPATQPNCTPGPVAVCENGNWVCPPGGPTQPAGCPQAQPECPGGMLSCQNGSWICQPAIQAPEPEQPQPSPTPEPQPTPEPTPAPEPAPEPTPAPEPVQTQEWPSLWTSFSRIVGLVTGNTGAYNTVCGNGVCETEAGESQNNCCEDCGDCQGPGEPGMGGPRIGPSPETLCNMTDEEIVEMYTQGMGMGMPQEKEMEYRCRSDSTRILQEMTRYKLEIARCRADAALDCEAKKQSAENCNAMKDSPEKIAELIVSNMCRRFGTTTTEQAKSKLYEVANKWYSEDPALANQLGDTADKTIEDQKNLGVLSYFFGDGGYASKLKDRTAKLRAIRERLVSKNVGDPETLSTLDSQINELETEANKFGNFFDVTRLGYLFR